MSYELDLASELEDIKKKGLYRSLRRLEGPLPARGQGAPGLEGRDLFGTGAPPPKCSPSCPSISGPGIPNFQFQISNFQFPIQSPLVLWEGRELLLLSSNSYLGLHTHPDLIEAACQALHRYGTGAGASRLISGNLELHEQLEEEIARFKGCEAALLFPTGYMANLGAITSLVDPQDLLASDELNHASLIDACRLSGATRKVYLHKDLEGLERILAEGTAHRRRLVVTDGVFSMDGDLAPLVEICALAERYGAMVLVDDAHGFGVLGEKGRGTIEHWGLEERRVAVQVGTLSKALANLGGYVAGSRVLIDYLRNRARTFIYSTALPPSVLAASLAALRLIGGEEGRCRRQALWANARYLREGLARLGYPHPEGETHILPLLIGEAEATLQLAEGLLQEGIYAPAIRPPTVPPGKSRLRLSLMSTHTRAQLDWALEALERVGGVNRVPGTL